MKTIVLSKDYIPLSYCDSKRAVALIYLEKAEMVKESGHYFQSVSGKHPIPQIIRLHTRLKKHVVMQISYSRKNVYARDNFSCQYCLSKKNLTLDHVFPISRGGESTWDNVVTACLPCNSKKRNRTPAEAKMRLLSIPRKPSIVDSIDWEDLISGINDSDNN